MKRIGIALLLMFLCTFSGSVSAQAPDTLWTRTYGGTSDDIGYSVIKTSDGGYLISGLTFSYAVGYNDVYLIKTNSDGDTLWTRSFGWNYGDVGISVIENSNNEYIITGMRSTGWQDVLFAKTSADGDVLLFTHFGGSNNEGGYSIQETSDGNYIIAGNTWSYSQYGQADVWLIKLDGNANFIWDKKFGGSQRDDGFSVQQTSDGGFVISGYTESFGAGNADVYLIKTDVNGDLVWDATYGGVNNEHGESVLQTPDGGYIIAGWTESFGSGGADIYVVKTDENGTAVWDTTIGGPGDDYGQSITSTFDGAYIIVGRTSSYGQGGEDIYLVKINDLGEVIWETTYGGSGNEWGYSIDNSNDCGYIVTGYTESFGAGGKDVWLIKLGSETGTITGTVTSPNGGLLRVPVNLVNFEGQLHSTSITNDSGYYEFVDIINGDYTVEVHVPLGYTPTSDQSVPVTVAGIDQEVNFTLEENPNTGNVREAWFWRWQVRTAQRGWGWAVYTGDELLEFLNQIHVHFDPHFPIYSEVEGLEGMNDVLSTRFRDPVIDRAKKHFFATLLNVVSGRLNTFQVVSHDDATATQAITYMAMLLTDDVPDNDWHVILIALNINCAWFDLPAGVIPLDLPQIAYKFCEDVEIPEKFSISQNYPNPFNDQTVIDYALPEPTYVSLEIYDILGRRVTTLVNSQQPAGYHQVVWNSDNVSSGMYFYKIQADKFIETKKMLLLK